MPNLNLKNMSEVENASPQSRLLTIGIPTYNRSSLLSECLSNLQEVLAGEVGSKVQLVISDNNSSDSTAQIVSDWLISNGSKLAIQVEYHRHDQNLGITPNTISLFDKATGEYFFQLGDDDNLRREELIQVIDLLELHRPSGAVQSIWPWHSENKSRQVSHREFSRYFYEFGNSWAGIYKVREVKEILLNREFRADLEANSWGQTPLGFMAVSTLGDTNLPWIFGFSWGDVVRNRPYEYDYSRLTRTLRDLLLAEYYFRFYGGDKELTRHFRQIRSGGYWAHFLGMVLQRTHNKGKKEVTFLSLGDAHLKSFGIFGLVPFLLLAALCSQPLNLIITTTWRILKKTPR